MTQIPPVSIITRTLGNALFLRRACAALAVAAPQGTEWILVDDAGNADTILAEITAEARSTQTLQPFIVRSASRHRALAMNAGLAAARGATIHILDDDDTIYPGFYVAALEALAERPEAGAVAVRCAMVEEQVDSDSLAIREIRRTPHFPEITAISIAMMLVQQLTPTCSLLFRANAMRGIGPFNPDLAVCEDYEFLLRFLLQHDIVLLDQMLAAFHTRTPDSATAFQNSESSRRHAEVDTAFRNAMLRRSLQNPDDKLGTLLLLGDLARGAVKIDRASVLLRKNRLWSWIYRLFRKR